MRNEGANRTQVDLLIHNAKVLTLNDSDDIFDPGVVAIRNDEIVWVGPEGSRPDQFEPRERLNMAGGLIMPGLVNSHTQTAPVVPDRLHGRAGQQVDLRMPGHLQQGRHT